MNYEEFYGQYLNLENKLAVASKNALKQQKSIAKDLAQGDLYSFEKSMTEMQSALSELQLQLQELKQLSDNFDGTAYLEEGDFARQLLSECERKNVDIKGDFPVFEILPFTVAVDKNTQQISIDRKKYKTIRPKYIVNTIVKMQDKLKSASFAAVRFATEISKVYDILLVLHGQKEGTDMYLMDIYQLMVPMARSRKDYSKQNFAYDISRLAVAGQIVLRDGRTFQLGTSRNNVKKGIRTLNPNGKEEFFATIRFYVA
ncbi:MAG: hypothetical protein LKE40_14040 [Spirochaetia bacterium]|jgi:hypothetical protein|nr:hypothetical protein [Spirochaetia bacterium]